MALKIIYRVGFVKYIIPNGQPLTAGQSMTVRVAIGAFAMDLQADGLGDDEHGKFMTRAYLDRINEIIQLLRLTHPAK